MANAILQTYFRSPCGENCVQNKTLDLEEFVKNLETDEESSNTTQEVCYNVYCNDQINCISLFTVYYEKIIFSENFDKKGTTFKNWLE